MTLVVAIKCTDGIVVGADGAATLGSMGNTTVRQSTKKLKIIDDKVILGTSGFIGLSQRIAGELEGLWIAKAFSGMKPHDVMTKIRIEFWNKHIQMEQQIASVAKNINPSSVQSAILASIVAMPVNSQFCLFQFTAEAAPEEATKDLPFVAIGSGQSIADPFLAFLRRVFWKDRLPSLAEGIFSAIWTLDHAIQIVPGFVADPVQIAVLEKVHKDIKARELEATEFEEHREAISEAEKILGNFRNLAEPSKDKT